ncbi:helix-turn-helix domain-containing protein [Phytohabitans rumicis]|uniref:HTH cro/C1-type domain-containing protein n=1 Tax=Phytohabitans rumicis TaxID=1076125 RepID=A0A6V8LBY9_9ACTN|nr:helix-turn-helix domain-containing protein [Phytohabitans rumicis]GFJ93150.1 hypothetical protein Prum_067920 [Phytohabitans rumicis]
MADGAEQRTRATFRVRLNYLFDTVRAPGRTTPYTAQEVADAIRDAGTDISKGYISLLRNGERSNPTMTIVQAIANFFQVPPAYFFDDAAYEAARRDLAELRAMKDVRDLLDDPGAALLGYRARNLTAAGVIEALRHVEAIIEREQAQRRRRPRRPDNRPET